MFQEDQVYFGKLCGGNDTKVQTLRTSGTGREKERRVFQAKEEHERRQRARGNMTKFVDFTHI